MATPTEEEIQKKQEAVHVLREKLAKEETREQENLQAVDRELRMKALEAEEERLQRHVEAQHERANKSSVREGAERVAEQAEDASPPPEATKSSSDAKKEG